MNKPKLTAILVLVITALIVAATFLLPIPPNEDWLNFHIYLAVATSVTLLFSGASIIFFQGLGNFTSQLKRSYFLICLGLILLGITMLQLPIQSYFQIGGDLLSGILGIFSVAISFTVLFIGTKTFAGLFGINNITTKGWFLLLVATGLTGLTVILPHAPTSLPEIIFDANSGFNMLSLTVMGFSAMHMYEVKRKASIGYAPALAWFIITMLTLATATLLFQVTTMLLDHWLVVTGLPLVPALIASFFMLLSAVSFSTITSQSNANSLTTITARNFFGKPLKPQPDTAISSIDIDTYTASLVSQPKEIDALVDQVRFITAHMNPGDRVTQQDENSLLNVYLQLEQYLLTKEKLRIFTKESLRQTIANGLRLSGTQNTFWNRLPA